MPGGGEFDSGFHENVKFPWVHGPHSWSTTWYLLFSSNLDVGLVENAAENIQGKKQFAKFRMLQIEEGKHVYFINTLVTLTFRIEVILVRRWWKQ